MLIVEVVVRESGGKGYTVSTALRPNLRMLSRRRQFDFGHNSSFFTTTFETATATFEIVDC